MAAANLLQQQLQQMERHLFQSLLLAHLHPCSPLDLLLQPFLLLVLHLTKKLHLQLLKCP